MTSQYYLQLKWQVLNKDYLWKYESSALQTWQHNYTGDEFPRGLCDPLPPVISFYHVSFQPTSDNIKQQSQEVGGHRVYKGIRHPNYTSQKCRCHGNSWLQSPSVRKRKKQQQHNKKTNILTLNHLKWDRGTGMVAIFSRLSSLAGVDGSWLRQKLGVYSFQILMNVLTMSLNALITKFVIIILEGPRVFAMTIDMGTTARYVSNNILQAFTVHVSFWLREIKVFAINRVFQNIAERNLISGDSLVEFDTRLLLMWLGWEAVVLLLPGIYFFFTYYCSLSPFFLKKPP